MTHKAADTVLVTAMHRSLQRLASTGVYDMQASQRPRLPVCASLLTHHIRPAASQPLHVVMCEVI
jgi:hypothetical protein